MYRREISTERKTFILITVLFLNLILISTNVVLKDKKTLFQSVVGIIVSPFQAGFQETVDFVSQKLRHYVFLKDTYRKYVEVKRRQSMLKYENYLLKKRIEDKAFLESVRALRKEFIVADVISVDRSFPLGTVMIDRGSRHGLEKEMIVLNGDAHLVGKVVEPVTAYTAKVRLLTSAVGGVGAYIKKNKLEGLLTGNNNSICSFKYLIENKPVELGDEIVTSGTDEIFPPYIPIGRVVEIEKEYLTQRVYVKPYFLEKSIKKLLVIKRIDETKN